jgi:hypothetical protein
MTTHSGARHIEAVAPQGAFQRQASSVQLPASTRNTRGNRNAPNSPLITNIIFPTRNKTGGVAKTKSQEFANVSSIEFLALPCPPKSALLLIGLPILPGEGGNLQNLIDTRIIRNHPNSPDVNENCRSNRYKTGARKLEIPPHIKWKATFGDPTKNDGDPEGGFTSHESLVTSH